MNYLMREKDAAEEERFQKLDMAIRSEIQKKRKWKLPKKGNKPK